MILAAIAGTINHASAQPYTVVDLGRLTDLAGRAESLPNDINNRGAVAAANVIGGAYRALLYNGSWTNLGTLGGAESIAAGLDDSGLVVGHSLTAGGLDHAFLWTPGGTDGVSANRQMRDLGTLGGLASEACSINSSGQITGYAQTANNEHAFRYSAGTMTDIGNLLDTSFPNSFGYGINEAGHIAGTAYNKNYSTSGAFYYNGSTALVLGTLGGRSSSALSINKADQIVGYASTAAGVDHAFRYAGGVMTDLGTLGGHWSYANAINNSNVIVGGSFIDAADSIYHATICFGSSMSDLNGQLDASGTGWVLVEARAINDYGQIIGVGTYGGVNHAFLLNPTPRITGVKMRGSNVLVSFTTIKTVPYALQGREQMGGGGWSSLVTNLTGTGNIITATNSGAAALRSHFYRASLCRP